MLLQIVVQFLGCRITGTANAALVRADAAVHLSPRRQRKLLWLCSVSQAWISPFCQNPAESSSSAAECNIQLQHCAFRAAFGCWVLHGKPQRGATPSLRSSCPRRRTAAGQGLSPASLGKLRPKRASCHVWGSSTAVAGEQSPAVSCLP